MSIYIDEASCLGSGSWPEVAAKAKHVAGDISIIRVTGGRHVWMPSDAAAAVRTGTKLLIAGGGLPLQGMENMGIERAVLASQDSLFEGGGYDTAEEGARFDSEGLPLCPGCGHAMHWESAGLRDTETFGGDEVEYTACPSCGKKWELVGRRNLYPTSSARGRGRRASGGRVNVGSGPERVNVGSEPGPVDVGTTPGVAMARRGPAIQVVLVNPDEEAAALVADALSGFGASVTGDGDSWLIDTSQPFVGDIGAAYISLVKLHRLISQRGVPPGLFRDLRDWVAGRS
jgi:hypothetical protein